LTPEGRPFLDFTLEWIDAEYGSVEGYFEKQLGFDAADIEKLRAMYRH
jgi:protein tyrosine/serine phosphatase